MAMTMEGSVFSDEAAREILTKAVRPVLEGWDRLP
jgi:hypothetical protein